MPVTCPFCPLRCDDIVIRVGGARVVPQGLECPRALLGFERVSSEAERIVASKIGGATPDAASPAAGSSSAIAPLVDRIASAAATRISGTIVDINTARAAVRLAAASGGIIDAAETGSSGAMRRAIERDGIVAATLGEIRHRADAVVMLGDPTEECPRLIERFLAPGPEPLAASRRFLSLGESRIPGLPADRYTHVEVGLGDLHRSLAEARGAMRVGHHDASHVSDWLRETRYVAWLWSSEVVDSLAAGALVGLIADLNRDRRAVAVSLGGDATLRSVSSWLTGLSGAVDFGGGTPQLLQRSATAPVTLWLQPHPMAPGPPLDSEFLVVIGMADAGVAERADLYLPAGVPGVDVAGGTIRGDGTVCLPLYATRDCGLPSAAALLSEITLKVSADSAARVAEKGQNAC